MGWGRKAHFYCEVDSSRKDREKICSDKHVGLTIKAAGWMGAIETVIRHSSLHGDQFEVSFTPWLKSKASGTGVILARGALNYDVLGPQLERDGPLIRLDRDILSALEFVKAKEIMMKGVDTDN